MIFTHIDPKNPYREFVAVVHVDEQNQYNGNDLCLHCLMASYCMGRFFEAAP